MLSWSNDHSMLLRLLSPLAWRNATLYHSFHLTHTQPTPPWTSMKIIWWFDDVIRFRDQLSLELFVPMITQCFFVFSPLWLNGMQRYITAFTSRTPSLHPIGLLSKSFGSMIIRETKFNFASHIWRLVFCKASLQGRVGNTAGFELSMSKIFVFSHLWLYKMQHYITTLTFWCFFMCPSLQSIDMSPSMLWVTLSICRSKCKSVWYQSDSLSCVIEQ